MRFAMVGKMQSLFPSTRALICFATDKLSARHDLFAHMVGKMQSLFPSIRALICFATDKLSARHNLFAHMVGKMQSLFPSTRALICFATKRPHGQAVKTSPSHGGIWGSIPHGGTKNPTLVCGIFPFHGELCVLRMQLCCTNPRTLGWRFTM